MPRGSHIVVAAVLLGLCSGAGLLAHDETPPPRAEFLISPLGERLTVTARLPIVAVSDVNFPRGRDGAILRGDLEQPLQIVAREVAASLELEQDGRALARPTAAASLTADGMFVDVELVYVIRQGVGNLSARLQSFRAGFNRVPTVARYVVSPGVTRTFEIADIAERISFDPPAAQAFGHFIGRGAGALLNDWDVVLFAICLVSMLPGRERRTSVMALLAGEAAAASMAVAVWPALPQGAMAMTATVAASAIVVAALQTMVSPDSRWRAPLALVFGLTNGVAIGQVFNGALSFAGSHTAWSFGAWLATILVGQLWVIALIASATRLLHRLGAPVHVVVLAASIVVCHEGLDRVIERGTRLAEATAIGAEHIFTGLTLAWASVVVLAGIVSALRAGVSGPPMLTDSTGAQP